MTVKEKITELFELNRGKYLSGAEIARQLECTRGAVWKAVKALQDEGYEITASTNKGYRLEENTDVITAEGIKKYLDTPERFDLHIFKTVDSTNTRLKEIAVSGAAEGTVVISGKQTGGKGRLGRSFFSPSDTGLYMSVLLRPRMSASEAIKITTAAAVAVAETVERLSGKQTRIKWVNDVYLENKKICGILTEASFGLENGGLEYAVLGIGVNAYEPYGGFPENVRDIAGSVFPQRIRDMRSRLAAGILNGFMKRYLDLGDPACCEDYRNRLMWRGEMISIISGAGAVPAVLKDTDTDYRLIVEYPDGSIGKISSGEISIRKA